MAASLVLGLASTGVAGVAIVGNIWINARSLRHQERMAIGARIWQARSTLYVDVLAAAAGEQDWRAVQSNLDDLHPRTQAFASDHVLGLVDELLASPHELHVSAYDHLVAQLVESIRAELDVDGVPRRRRSA